MTNNTNNSSPTEIPRPDCVLEFAKLFPIALLIVITNGIVFALFLSRRKLRTPSNLLLLSLAVSDFLNGALNCPLMLAILCGKGQVGPFLAPLHNFSTASCSFHILAITAEKYVAIVWPLRHQAITKKTVRRFLAGIWLASLVIASLPFIWYKKPSVGHMKDVYAGFCLLVVFLMPYICMMYGYVVMFKVINRRNNGNNQLLNISDRRRSRIDRKMKIERKCLIIFASMAVIFVVCWLPFYVLKLVTSVLPRRAALDLEVFFQVFVIIRYLSSIINPLLYTFFKRDFWKAFKQLAQNKCRSVSSRVSLSATTMRRGSDIVLLALRRKLSNIPSAENASELCPRSAALETESEPLNSEPPSEILYVSVV